MSQQDQPVPPPAAVEDAPAPRRRTRRWRRVPLRILAVVVAIVAGLLVSFLTVDLGPTLRDDAERAATNYLKRPMRIGRLKAKLTPGVFVLEDIVIEGLEPGHRPFLTAKALQVELPWWTIFTRKLTIESIAMSDWNMVIETWPGSPQFPNGRHNFPRFTRDRDPNAPPSRFKFTTTLKSLLASRGQVTYEDHGTPWSTVARDMRVTMTATAVESSSAGICATRPSPIDSSV